MLHTANIEADLELGLIEGFFVTSYHTTIPILHCGALFWVDKLHRDIPINSFFH